jgi:SAM-dependent methyltransferase
MDYSMAKTVFASGALPWARLACGDAVRLPFRRGVFERVLCRDLLHHLRAPEQRAAVEEMFRVCRPGGEVLVIEPNGRNPLIGAFALLVPAERGMLHSTPERIAGLLRERAARVSVEMAQPLPVARALLHYRFGVPGLGSRRIVAGLLGIVDAVLKRLVPRRLWAYIVLRAVPPGPVAGSHTDPEIR